MTLQQPDVTQNGGIQMAEETRIDKYLWAIRVYKTRSEATDACRGGKIRLNGADVKPSRTVKAGDEIISG